MNVGDIVAIATEVDKVVTKVPAIVVALYKNTHGELVADLHQLEATIHGVISGDDNPPEALPPGAPVVTADLSVPEPEQPAAPAPPAATAEEVAADKAAIADLQAQLDAANAKLSADDGDTPDSGTTAQGLTQGTGLPS